MFLSSWLYVPALAVLLDRKIWWPAKASRPTPPPPPAPTEVWTPPHTYETAAR
jgi:hypothetical protein